MKTKLLRKYTALITIIILLLYQLTPLAVSRSFAEDSPEEILREQQEAEREAQVEAERQARREAAQQAEAEREAQEAEREAHEDDPPLPSEPIPTITPPPPPSTSFVDVDTNLGGGATSSNSDVGAGSTNTADATQNTTIDNQNTNQANVSGSISVVSNTGENVISGDSPPSPTPTPPPPGTPPPLPGCEDRPPLAVEEQQPQEGTNNDTTNIEDTSGEVSQPSAFLFFIGKTYAQEASPSGTTQETSSDDFSTETGSTNEDTGSLSESHADTTDSDALVASNKNCAEIDDTTSSSATTGENNASGNDGGVAMQTGDATASGQVVNQGNTNTVELQGDGSTAQNTNTGDDSVNVATTEEEDTIVVENTNYITTENTLTVEATSGENMLVDNEGYNRLSTGDLELMAYLLNILNMNITGKDFTHLIVNIFGNLNGQVDLDDIANDLGIDPRVIFSVARNSDTGDGSYNSASVEDTTSVSVDNTNVADVRNDVTVTGVSGGNNISQGEDAIHAMTGRIMILAAIMNFINTNFAGEDWYFAMVNIFGNLHGDILIPGTNQYLQGGAGVLAQNSATGDGSINDASVSLASNMTATNNNEANVTNNINAVGDSGSNVSYGSEDLTRINSGAVNANGDVLNWINFNLTGQNFVLLIVNVFGKWFGQVLAFPGQGDIPAPEDGTLVAIARGAGGPAATAENFNTGANSENYASVEHQFDIDAQNNNSVNIENNITVTGVSGQNTLNQNEDPEFLTTGWIDLNVGLLNILNFNVTGRNWMVLFVNVFGDFFGNVVFPGAPPPLATTENAINGTVATIEQAVGGLNEFTQETPKPNANQANQQIASIGRRSTRIREAAGPEGLWPGGKGGENINAIVGSVPPNPVNQDSINQANLESYVAARFTEEDFFEPLFLSTEKGAPFAFYGIIYSLGLFLLFRRKRGLDLRDDLPIPRFPLP